jgi:8-oxo-dGTP pyrophosphatase MutT (NUDIX family)
MQLPNIPVPRAVQRAAEAALALHRESALPVEQEVSGVALAERLASGSVPAEDVGALARFFQVNERRYGACLQAFRSARTDGLCRSWALRGGEHGRVWAERQRDALVREGILPADPYSALLRAEPDEVYARFAVGAFRWEYGIDTPGKAARFYEDYHRATGRVLDLHSAFGPSGESVAIAIRRRVYGENPFDALRRAMQFEDAEYRLAAMVDEQELRATGQLDENIKPFLLQGPGEPLKSTIKIVWPTFIAYMILASEQPDLLADLHGESKKPPTLLQEPTSLLHYSDAVRIYIAFFHPKGAYWKETAGTDFEDLPGEIESLMLRAHAGRKLVPLQVQKILGAARRWTAENKIAGSLFHVYNADWKKGNWQNILDALPIDVDVRGPFQKFVEAAPVPAGGVKLQQTISDKTQLKAIAKHFLVSDPDALEQRKVGLTPFGVATEKLGRPVGVYSVIRTGIIDRTLLGCFERPEGWVFVMQSTNGTLSSVPIDYALDQLHAGNWTVTKAHKDMKLGYGVATSGPKAAAMATPTNIGGEAPPAISKEANPDSAISKAVATPSFELPKDQNITGLAPSAPKPVPVSNPKEPFGFDVDEVVEMPGAAGPVFLWIREVTPVSYRAINLTTHYGVQSVPMVYLKPKLDNGKAVGKFTSPAALAPFIKIGGTVMVGGANTDLLYPMPAMFALDGTELSPGVETSDGVIAAVFAAKLPSSELRYPVLVLFDGKNLHVKPQPAIAPKSSYAPTDPKPESNLSEDANELSGTQQAFDWLAQKGWTPTVASEGAGQFKLALAGVYQYGSIKTRTILGYGKSDQGGFVYVIRTEKGTVNWKSVVGGNTDYAPLLKTDDIVLGELLPPPGTGSTKFPKLNYRLSNKARAVAKENGLVYQPAPKDAPFRVGVPLEMTTGEKTRILGWIKGVTGLEAVLDHGGETSYSVVSVGSLKQLSLVYERGTELSDTGEVVFGKQAGAAAVSVVNAFDVKAPIPIPSTPPSGWDSPAPVEETEMAKPAKGKHAAAGILAVFPAGTKISSGSGLFISPFPSVVLCYPSGAYGGYTLAIPKGTVDQGESPLLAAVREFNEETGLTAKPVAHLGDFRASTSVVRLYVGFVTGGNPAAKPKNDEVDAVTLKPLTDIDNSGFQNEKWWTDLIPSGGSNWQQDAMTKLVAWLVQNGMPQTYGPKSTPASHSQVTHPGDVQAAPLSPALFSGTLIPQEPGTDVWKTLLFKAPFPVTTAMVVALKAKVKSGTAAEPTSFSAAKVRAVGPAFGQVFETSAGTPYTAAGYVSWLGTDGKDYHYLLGLSGAGLIEALPVSANGTSDLHVSATDTESLVSKDPWYSHPDPSVMARMKMIWDAKGSLAPAKVNMQTFKLNWLKDAGVPYYAVASSNILQELSGLFVGGALTEAQKDAVVACLKARMTATQSGKKSKGSAPLAVSSQAPTAPLSVPAAPPKPKVVVDKMHLPASALATLSYPQSAQLTPINAAKVSSSSKPSRVVQDQHGNKFFVKWRKGEPWQAEIDRAASLMMVKVKGGVIPVNTFDYEGNRASIQPFFDTAEPAPSNPNDLSDANKAELLSQHAFDMFVGDHDGHGGNWIQVGSKIIAVDRGQSFKFLLLGTEDSLDPKWHAPGNIGNGYAKQLLIDWGKNSASIPVSAFSAMRATIESIQSQLTTTAVMSVIAALASARGLSASEEAALLTKLEKRRASYLDDWTTVLRKLRKDFAWPGSSGGLKVDLDQLLTVSPSEMAFGKQEEATIDEAKKAGWQGKSLRVDGPWVENQEVMCKAVLWEDSGTKTSATLIHFRLTKQAGLRAAQALLASGVVEVSDGPGGPQRLAIDKANSVYEKLFAAIKTINYHLTGPKPDGVPNQTTVAAAVALKPLLQQILEQSKDPKGTFAQTGEPNEAVNAMADQYLGYVSTIEYWNANASTLIGQHSPVFTEFVFEEPPETKKPKPKKLFQAKLKNQGASYPNITNDAGQIVVRNLHKPVVNSSQVSQFVIEDPKTGAKLFFNPTAQSGDIKAGVQGVKGLCWGVLPGEPSTHVVVHLLKLFSEATSIPMNRATEADQRVLYLAKQAAALQGGGVFKPTADGTALVEPELVSAMSSYESGDPATAAKKLVNFVAGKAAIPPEDVLAAAKQDAAGMHDARGAGFYRHNRIGWDLARIKSVLGNTTYVAHALLGHSTTLQFFKDVAVNGALLANEVKPFYGVVKDGASPSSDFSQGGSQGIFCCLRKGGFYPKHLYFNLTLALRLDVYMVGTGDSFGNVHTERRTMPDKWTVGSGSIGASSSGQLLVRHDIDLQTYLVIAKCASQSEADQCIALVKQLGWKFRAGPPEKIFIA